MIRTIRLDKNNLSRQTLFLKFAIFWVVVGLTENLNVIASKCRSDDKHPKTS